MSLKVNVWCDHLYFSACLNSRRQLSCNFFKYSSRIVFQAFCWTFKAQRLKASFKGCFLFCWRSVLIMLRSRFWGSQCLTDGVPLCNFLFRYAFTALAVRLGPFSCKKVSANQLLSRMYCTVNQNLTAFFCIHIFHLSWHWLKSSHRVSTILFLLFVCFCRWV